MLSLEYLKTILRYDPDSPTCLTFIKSGKVAGFKDKNNYKHGGASYTWYIRHKAVKVNLDRVVYSLYHNIEIPETLFVRLIDGDLDNHRPDNLALYPKRRKCTIMNQCNLKAYAEFKTVILPKTNPDYFKHPKDWTDPEALAALEKEKEQRLSGHSVPPKRGHKTKFK